jgi:hypothetical protein
MKVSVELYIVFQFGGYRAFRCFAPYHTENEYSILSVVGLQLGSMLGSMAHTIVDVANKRVLKHRPPGELVLSDDFMNMIKSMQITDYAEVMRYAHQLPSGDILEFKDEHHFLSNFHPATFVWRHIIWLNSEAAYQAAKSNDYGTWLEFAKMRNPAQAKQAGKTVKMRDDWDEVKVGIMREIVFEKFNQNPDLKALLVATGDAKLEEGNAWEDVFWGICPPGSGVGHNYLGNILMDVRRSLRSQTF